MDDGFQLAGKQKLGDRLEILVRSHGAAYEADLLSKDQARIDLDLRAAGVSHDNDTPSPGCSPHTQGQGGLADIIHHHIHAPLFRYPVDLPAPIDQGAIVDDVRPESLGAMVGSVFPIESRLSAETFITPQGVCHDERQRSRGRNRGGSA